jgi:hypothetical protein
MSFLSSASLAHFVMASTTLVPSLALVSKNCTFHALAACRPAEVDTCLPGRSLLFPTSTMAGTGAVLSRSTSWMLCIQVLMDLKVLSSVTS